MIAQSQPGPPPLTVTLLAGLLIPGQAHAVPVKLASLPLSVEPNAKLLTLNQAGIRAAFPSAAGRPDAVFMTEDRKVSVAFEWRTSKLASNEIDKLVAQFPAVIRAQVPNVKSLKATLVQVGGSPWAQFVFTTPGQDDDLRRKSANYQIVGSYESQWGPMFEALGIAVAEAPPVKPKPLTQDGLLGLFSADVTGADFVLTPASDADMRGKNAVVKPSLEVVYDNV